MEDIKGKNKEERFEILSLLNKIEVITT